MKIRPTSAFMADRVTETGSASCSWACARTSATRRRSVETHGLDHGRTGERLNPHSDLKGCMVFRPIVDLTTDEVWQT